MSTNNNTTPVIYFDDQFDGTGSVSFHQPQVGLWASAFDMQLSGTGTAMFTTTPEAGAGAWSTPFYVVGDTVHATMSFSVGDTGDFAIGQFVLARSSLPPPQFAGRGIVVAVIRNPQPEPAGLMIGFVGTDESTPVEVIWPVQAQLIDGTNTVRLVVSGNTITGYLNDQVIVNEIIPSYGSQSPTNFFGGRISPDATSDGDTLLVVSGTPGFSFDSVTIASSIPDNGGGSGGGGGGGGNIVDGIPIGYDVVSVGSTIDVVDGLVETAGVGLCKWYKLTVTQPESLTTVDDVVASLGTFGVSVGTQASTSGVLPSIAVYSASGSRLYVSNSRAVSLDSSFTYIDYAKVTVLTERVLGASTVYYIAVSMTPTMIDESQWPANSFPVTSGPLLPAPYTTPLTVNMRQPERIDITQHHSGSVLIGQNDVVYVLDVSRYVYDATFRCRITNYDGSAVTVLSPVVEKTTGALAEPSSTLMETWLNSDVVGGFETHTTLANQLPSPHRVRVSGGFVLQPNQWVDLAYDANVRAFVVTLHDSSLPSVSLTAQSDTQEVGTPGSVYLSPEETTQSGSVLASWGLLPYISATPDTHRVTADRQTGSFRINKAGVYHIQVSADVLVSASYPDGLLSDAWSYTNTLDGKLDIAVIDTNTGTRLRTAVCSAPIPSAPIGLPSQPASHNRLYQYTIGVDVTAALNPGSVISASVGYTKTHNNAVIITPKMITATIHNRQTAAMLAYDNMDWVMFTPSVWLLYQPS